MADHSVIPGTGSTPTSSPMPAASMQAGQTHLGQRVESFLRGAALGQFADQTGADAGAGCIVAGLLPGIGQLADARDTAAAGLHVWQGKPGGLAELAWAAIGWIPLAGDFAKAASVRRTMKRYQADPQRSGRQSLWNRLVPERSVTPTTSLPAGVGYTDKYGNIVYSSRGPASEAKLVLAHEQVHAFLSPRLEVLREFRADLRMSLYNRSSFLRYLEEALAESYAQLKVNGLTALPEGLRFPISNGYVELKDVATEAAIGTVTVGGAAYGVYMTVSE